jgi:signal transduction histidine kinase/DNA-binding NarL/FixJ family response regulator
VGNQHSPEQGQPWRGDDAGEFCRAVVECLNRSHVYFVSADSGGRIVASNHAMAHLLGLCPDGFDTESIWDKLPESDGARLRQRLQQTPSGTDPLMLNFVAPDHVPTTLDCSLAPMPSGHFAIIGVPARSSADDSEVAWLRLNNAFATLSRENARKSKQLELQNSELARTAGELQQANQALTEARAAALRAAQAKSDFLSHMSHEIRTPMNGVIGMVQLLLATSLSAEQQRYAEVAQTSGRTLLALIDDILDLAKIEAGKVSIESLDFDLRRTVEDFSEVWRIQGDVKGLAFRLHVAPETPAFLRGDPNRLRQVLNNLAANAIKFTQRGEVALHVEPVSREDGKATVRFAVTDTGIGIRPDRAAALFSPFVQADVSTTRKYGGTGLGLAICKQLAGMMGGQIGIESREGEGSTFWFTAVFETRPAPALTSAAEPESASLRKPVSPRTGARHDARILIAEDNPTNRTVLLAQLGKLGYQAGTAANGVEAVEALRHGGYDLILMDCEMPVMDGYEATRRIRQSGHPRLPIIAVTAHAMTGDRDRCIREGMNDFLSKPVDLRCLAEMLAKWLPEAHPPDASQSTAPAHPPGAAQSTAPAPLEPATAVFDPDALLRRLMGDRHLAGIIVKGFLKDFPSQWNTLRMRLAEADGPGARLQAHALKGSAATVSAGSLRAIAGEMERLAGAGGLDRFGELLPSVAEEFERFKSSLKQAGWL